LQRVIQIVTPILDNQLSLCFYLVL
jgi:hypothetical protein